MLNAILLALGREDCLISRNLEFKSFQRSFKPLSSNSVPYIPQYIMDFPLSNSKVLVANRY